MVELIKHTRYSYFIGVDPGKSGAIVVLSDDDIIEVFGIPETVVGYKVILNQFKDSSFAIVEKVASMPQNGVKASFTFGYGVSRLHTMLEVCGIPFELCTPQKWLKFYQMSKDKGEDKSKWKWRLVERAQQLFPDVKVTKVNADALLIAHYCRETKR